MPPVLNQLDNADMVLVQGLGTKIGRNNFMCGRKFNQEDLSWADYREIFNIVQPAPPSNFEPNYNICPTQLVPICINRDGERQIVPMHWGLVPHWAKDKKFAANMINARAETLAEKPAFRSLLAAHRCIILTSGFYEWQREHADGRKNKIPYKVMREDGRPMLLAGLWTENSALAVQSYAVITTDAPPAFAAIHHRAPAMLEPEQIATWLEGSWAEAQPLTQPYQGRLTSTMISSAVNSNRNNGPQLLTPVVG